MGDLLEADAYTVEEVPDTVVVQACANDPKYRDCNCDPNVGLMGHKDLMVAFGKTINNAVVFKANIRAMEVWKLNILCFQMTITCKMPFFCHNNSMLNICPNGIVVGLFALGICIIQIHRCIPFAAAPRFPYKIVQMPNSLCQHACITKWGGIFF